MEATKKAPYSVDENLYHTSYESGMLEDPMVPPLKEMFKMVGALICKTARIDGMDGCGD